MYIYVYIYIYIYIPSSYSPTHSFTLVPGRLLSCGLHKKQYRFYMCVNIYLYIYMYALSRL